MIKYAQQKQTVIGTSPAFQNAFNSTRLVAATDVTVLLEGESGTGKEVMARAIHDNSRRNEQNFVSVDCTSLPENLAESELFGHRKGAFTGADRDYTGRIQAAHNGTLFLDEIGELPLSIQAKLLRFLELGLIHPLGEASPRKVDVRVIAATNRNLAEMVEQGTFRQDLFYRLNIVPVSLPPLRERDDDIGALLTYFVKQFAHTHALDAPRFSKSAVKLITGHRWPGNVRELRNFCERMVILFPGVEIQPENLPVELKPSHTGAKPAVLPFTFPEEGLCLATLERQVLSQALEKAQGNQSRAARLLGLSRDTFLYRMKKYALDV